MPASATTSASSTPPSRSRVRTEGGSLMRSHGLKPLYRSGLTSRTEFQNAVVAGSKKRGPHVVIAASPPGERHAKAPLSQQAYRGQRRCRRRIQRHQILMQADADRACHRREIQCCATRAPRPLVAPARATLAPGPCRERIRPGLPFLPLAGPRPRCRSTRRGRANQPVDEDGRWWPGRSAPKRSSPGHRRNRLRRCKWKPL